MTWHWRNPGNCTECPPGRRGLHRCSLWQALSARPMQNDVVAVHQQIVVHRLLRCGEGASRGRRAMALSTRSCRRMGPKVRYENGLQLFVFLRRAGTTPLALRAGGFGRRRRGLPGGIHGGHMHQRRRLIPFHGKAPRHGRRTRNRPCFPYPHPRCSRCGNHLCGIGGGA